MFEIHTQEIEFGAQKLSLETGRIARQAGGAVLVTYGNTKVLCTAVAQKNSSAEFSFFPLTVHYQERTYAAGKIPGGFFKREGRPSEKEVLTSRLIDRPIRPLFEAGFKNETQIICTVLQHDLENNPDIPALIGASAALALSGAPFLGPLGAARVGYINEQYVLNPSTEDMQDSLLDLIVAGTDEGVLMVESEASELSEDVMLGAVTFGHTSFQPVIAAINALAKKAGKEKWYQQQQDPLEDYTKAKLRDTFAASIEQAYQETVKQTRQEKLGAIHEAALSITTDSDEPIHSGLIKTLLKEIEADIVRSSILETGIRIDGRSTTQIRPIDASVGVLDQAHGTALFTRGETQALVVATLGSTQDEQIVDALDGEYRERFMLHYNFPPFSVGETGRMMSPGRREIGHGKLAWRALNPLLPSPEDFPYTMRVVSEITESNGSSSMATVCGTSMALMDAGVQMKQPCAGIAMGLIKQNDQFAVLSDILGDEDHLGDMDFKVAGTTTGITALQMDIKITSITPDIMRQALTQAHDGRKHILECMSSSISDAREEVSKHAPRIHTLQIPREKIRDVIGSGGKVIRELCAETGAKIDIDDEGVIKIAAVDQDSAQDAINRIQAIVAEPEAGRIYHGKVVKLMDFGAFVNFMHAKDGLVHISEMAEKHVNKVSDVVQEGAMVYVKCLNVDERGKVRLSMRAVNQETGEELPQTSSKADTSNAQKTSDENPNRDVKDRNQAKKSSPEKTENGKIQKPRFFDN